MILLYHDKVNDEFAGLDIHFFNYNRTSKVLQYTFGNPVSVKVLYYSRDKYDDVFVYDHGKLVIDIDDM